MSSRVTVMINLKENCPQRFGVSGLRTTTTIVLYTKIIDNLLLVHTIIFFINNEYVKRGQRKKCTK